MCTESLFPEFIGALEPAPMEAKMPVAKHTLIRQTPTQPVTCEG
jgi:hypothetical protein